MRTRVYDWQADDVYRLALCAGTLPAMYDLTLVASRDVALRMRRRMRRHGRVVLRVEGRL